MASIKKRMQRQNPIEPYPFAEGRGGQFGGGTQGSSLFQEFFPRLGGNIPSGQPEDRFDPNRTRTQFMLPAQRNRMRRGGRHSMYPGSFF